MFQNQVPMHHKIQNDFGKVSIKLGSTHQF
jgi:hypothetical protein